ncbi:MAG TPA: phosphopantothenoylcysteine decarboxylase [Pirellulales bacterium]|jgi:phosphopantothenoylcysteine decarboxylase/phosphopantothenate--cysteine ligase|nr:phosphopantothenoylcysteine decarboxylase [Pirellulales bacterium]
MARILITAGPTREHLDPVRYLSNASTGRMGRALAAAAMDAGHEVLIVSGPVEVEYPQAAEVIRVVSTDEMLAACRDHFGRCDGLIGVAAPCDYRPAHIEPRKIRKSGAPLQLELHETPDIVASVAAGRRSGQWLVGFALETEDHHLRAMAKLEQKHCDLIVVNGVAAIGATDNTVEILDRSGRVVAALAGSKDEVARSIFALIQSRLIVPR